MIFFGKRESGKFRVSISFIKAPGLVAYKGNERISIPHFYINVKLGYRKYWVGYNRLKRIIRDELYILDGEKIYYENGVGGRIEETKVKNLKKNNGKRKK